MAAGQLKQQRRQWQRWKQLSAEGNTEVEEGYQSIQSVNESIPPAEGETGRERDRTGEWVWASSGMRSLSVLGPGASEVYCAHQEKDEFHCDPRARMMDGWARRRVLPALEPRDWRPDTGDPRPRLDGHLEEQQARPERGSREGPFHGPRPVQLDGKTGWTGRCHCYCYCH